MTHLGMESGKWPVWAFTDERAAATWASQEPRRYVWGVLSLTLGPLLVAETVPAQVVLTQPVLAQEPTP